MACLRVGRRDVILWRKKIYRAHYSSLHQRKKVINARKFPIERISRLVGGASKKNQTARRSRSLVLDMLPPWTRICLSYVGISGCVWFCFCGRVVTCTRAFRMKCNFCVSSVEVYLLYYERSSYNKELWWVSTIDSCMRIEFFKDVSLKHVLLGRFFTFDWKDQLARWMDQMVWFIWESGVGGFFFVS